MKVDMQHGHQHLHDRRGILSAVGEWLSHNLKLVTNNNKLASTPAPAEDAAASHATVFQTVYQTMAPTFDGPIAGYSTLVNDPPSSAPASSDASPTPAPAPAASPLVAANAAVQVQPSTSSSVTLSSSGASPPSSTSSASSSGQLSHPPSTTASSSTASALKAVSLEGNLFSATSDPTTTPSAMGDSANVNNQDAGGISTGAKVIIASAVLAGALLIGVLVFFLFRYRRKQIVQRGAHGDAEKQRRGKRGGSNTFGPMTSAPRISLRPVTQFLPNWSGLEKASKSNATSPRSPLSNVMMARSPGRTAWDRPGTSQSTNSANPFGHNAERLFTPMIEKERMPPPNTMKEVPLIPMEAQPAPHHGQQSVPEAAASPLSRKISVRKDTPNNHQNDGPMNDGTLNDGPMDGEPISDESTRSPSSAKTSPTSSGQLEPGSPRSEQDAGTAPPPEMIPVAAAGKPPNSGVYRVQLDFKPTLEDELELRAGELIRLLHTYDDGWALVIRLDRSQQGVVPRTCLSDRPVKPRAPPGAPRFGPPINPQGYPAFAGYPPSQPGSAPQGDLPLIPQEMPPSGRQGRPMGPPQGMPRPQGPPPYRPQDFRRMQQGPPHGPPSRKPVPGVDF